VVAKIVSMIIIILDFIIPPLMKVKGVASIANITTAILGYIKISLMAGNRPSSKNEEIECVLNNVNLNLAIDCFSSS
jgi:hypothetical protein